MSKLDRCLNVWDLRDAARRRLPKGVFDFVDRATEDHIAVTNNRSAFERIKLRHRALVDVSGRSTATTLFGKPASLPMAIAPTGAAGLCWHQGELELARAAAAAKIPLTLSTASMTAMEKIVAAGGPDKGGRLWFQLYVWKQRELSHELIRRALPQRVRGADRHRRFPRLPQPRIQHAQRLRPAVQADAALRGGRGAASGLGAERTAEILHRRRLSAARELSRRNTSVRSSAVPARSRACARIRWHGKTSQCSATCGPAC